MSQHSCGTSTGCYNHMLTSNQKEMFVALLCVLHTLSNILLLPLNGQMWGSLTFTSNKFTVSTDSNSNLSLYYLCHDGGLPLNNAYYWWHQCICV